MVNPHFTSSLFLVWFTLLTHVFGLPADALRKPDGAINGELDQSNGTFTIQDSKLMCQLWPGFRPTVERALEQSLPIIKNTVESFQLLRSLYLDDGSGFLRPEKETTDHRTFDEENVFSTFSMFVRRGVFPSQPDWNAETPGIIDGLVNIAKTMVTNMEAYLSNTHLPGVPNIDFHCDEEEWLSDTDDNGITYIEALGVPNPNRLGEYVMSARGSVHQPSTDPLSSRSWVPIDDVCAQIPGQKSRQFGTLTVPTDGSAYAVTLGDRSRMFDEVITFCPRHFKTWLEFEGAMMNAKSHFNNLHVPWGAQPTEQQSDTIKSLRDQKKDATWLNDFFIGTLIHEMTHTRAMVPPGVTPHDDIKCLKFSPIKGTSSLDCLSAVAKGVDGLAHVNGISTKPQGHRDGEAFSMFAMAMWVNAGTWWDYKPKPR